MPAFELAVTQRADMIETDLHVARDREIVITHDEDLDRIGGSGEVAQTDSAAIRALDAGGGAAVPTLDEVLDTFGQRIPFNLELKCASAGRYSGLERAALAAVEARGLLERTLFSSFQDETLAELRSLSSGSRLALLLSARDSERPMQRAHALGAEAINPSLMVVTPALISAAHAEGLAVYVYTVDAEADMRRLIDAGVDGLFTNHPARMRAILGSPGGKCPEPNISGV
jgi:glycerophosphoryl diester phosphodiesterase